MEAFLFRIDLFHDRQVLLLFCFFVMKASPVVFTVEIVVIRCESTVCEVISFSSDWIRVRDRSEKRTYRLIICSLFSECPTVGPDVVFEFSPRIGI